MTITDKRNNSMDPDDDGDEVEIHTRDPFQLELLNAVRKRRSRVTGFNEDEAKSVPTFDAAKNSKLSKFMAKGTNNVEERVNGSVRSSRPTSLITENDKWTPSINLDDSDDEFLDEDDYSDDEYDGFGTSSNLLVTKPRDGLTSPLKRTSSKSDYYSRDSDLVVHSHGVNDFEKENFPLDDSKSNIINNMNEMENFERSRSFGDSDFDRKSKKSKYEHEDLHENKSTSKVKESKKYIRQVSDENERSSQSINDMRMKFERDAGSELAAQRRGHARRRSSSVEENDILDSSFSKSQRRPIPTPRKRTEGVSPRYAEHQEDERGGTREGRDALFPERKLSQKSPVGIDVGGKSGRKSVVDFEIGSDSSDDDDAFRKESQPKQRLGRESRTSALKEASLGNDRGRRTSGSKDVSPGDGIKRRSSDVKVDAKESRRVSSAKSTVSSVRTVKETKTSLGRRSSYGRQLSDQSERPVGGTHDARKEKMSKDRSVTDTTDAKKKVSYSKDKSPRRTSASRSNSSVHDELTKNRKTSNRTELLKDEDDLNGEVNDTLGASFREIRKSRSVTDTVDNEQQALDDIFSAAGMGDRELDGKSFGRQLSMPEKKSADPRRGTPKDGSPLDDNTLKPRRKSGTSSAGSLQSPRGKTQTPETKSSSRRPSSATSKQRASVAGPVPGTLRPKSGRRVSEASVGSRSVRGPIKAGRSETVHSRDEMEKSQGTRKMSRKTSMPDSGRTSLSPRGQIQKTVSPNTAQNKDIRYERSQSFNNISNIKPPLTKSKAQAGDSFTDSKSIRNQIYQEWVTRKTSVIKQQVKVERKSSKMQEVEKTELEKSRKIEAQKAFEAWNSTKAEKLYDVKKQVKEQKLKEKEKEDELVQKKLDAKKYFESWKSSKDEVLKDKHKKTRVEERQATLRATKEKESKKEDAQKVFDNWKARKEEQLKEKRAKDLQKAKEEKLKNRKESERKEKAKEVYEKWKETKPTKTRSGSTTLVQRPWCPGSRFSTNAIPERVQPVIQAGTANRARSATYARQVSSSRKLSGQ